MEKKYILISGALALVLIAGVLFWSSSKGGVNGISVLNLGTEVDFYKSMSCGCCSIHANYLEGKGEMKVNMVGVDDISEIKKKYNIPTEMQSCHTAIIGDYFVEGHMPIEAINKLLTEKPDIAGIALPGMPSGSPGMPGGKDGPFIVYAVNKDGSYNEFMRV